MRRRSSLLLPPTHPLFQSKSHPQPQPHRRRYTRLSRTQKFLLLSFLCIVTVIVLTLVHTVGVATSKGKSRWMILSPSTVWRQSKPQEDVSLLVEEDCVEDDEMSTDETVQGEKDLEDNVSIRVVIQELGYHSPTTTRTQPQKMMVTAPDSLPSVPLAARNPHVHHGLPQNRHHHQRLFSAPHIVDATKAIQTVALTPTASLSLFQSASVRARFSVTKITLPATLPISWPTAPLKMQLFTTQPRPISTQLPIEALPIPTPQQQPTPLPTSPIITSTSPRNSPELAFSTPPEMLHLLPQEEGVQTTCLILNPSFKQQHRPIHIRGRVYNYRGARTVCVPVTVTDQETIQESVTRRRAVKAKRGVVKNTGNSSGGGLSQGGNDYGEEAGGNFTYMGGDDGLGSVNGGTLGGAGGGGGSSSGTAGTPGKKGCSPRVARFEWWRWALVCLAAVATLMTAL